MASQLGEVRKKHEMTQMGLSPEPSRYVIRKMNQAIRFYSDYRDFENAFPYGGGLWEQPLSWLRPVRCIMRAEAQAEREKQRERSPEREAGEEWDE